MVSRSVSLFEQLASSFSARIALIACMFGAGTLLPLLIGKELSFSGIDAPLFSLHPDLLDHNFA